MTSLDEAAITALVHLSAVVSVMAIAFVGIDRARTEPDTVQEAIKEAKPAAAELMLRLGLTNGISLDLLGKDFWSIGSLLPAGVISVVAGKPIDLGPFQPVYAVYGLFQIPLFMFLRSRVYLRLVGFVAATSLCIFFVLVGSLVWQSTDWLVECDSGFLKLIYIVLIIFSVTVIGIGTAAHFMTKERLEERCAAMHILVNERIEKAKILRMKRIDKAILRVEKAQKALALAQAEASQRNSPDPPSDPSPPGNAGSGAFSDPGASI